jgi:hypothetical protein
MRPVGQSGRVQTHSRVHALNVPCGVRLPRARAQEITRSGGPSFTEHEREAKDQAATARVVPGDDAVSA